MFPSVSSHRTTASVVSGRRLIQGDAQVDLDVRPGHAHLLDQQAHEPLTLLEVEGVHSVPYTRRERIDPMCQPVVDGERLPFGHQCFSLLLELPVPLDHLSMARLEFRELEGLHLIQINDPSSLALGLLQAPI